MMKRVAMCLMGAFMFAACGAPQSSRTTPLPDPNAREFHAVASAGPSTDAECRNHQGEVLNRNQFDSGQNLGQGVFHLRLKSSGATYIGVSYGVTSNFGATAVLKTCGFLQAR